MQTVKMLKQASTGRLFPYSDVLASRSDMSAIDVPLQDAMLPNKPVEETPLRLHMDKSQKVGTGWIKNNRGTWTRRKKK